MKYAKIKFNDIANCPGVALSVYLQGCPHHCPNCFNPETWDFDGGEEFTVEVLQSIIAGLTKNGVKRSLCILGGEPLCKENAFLTNFIISEVKKELPQVKIFIWTGYLYKELLKSANPHIKSIFQKADYLIDGRFEEKQKDITLTMRGSKNQKIYNLQTGIDETEKFEKIKNK